MNVNTNIIKKQSQELCVIVNGVCNHASVLIETWDFGYPSTDVDGEPDYVEDDRKVIVCSKCRCWQESIEDEWHGIAILPEPYVTNNGKLVLV